MTGNKTNGNGNGHAGEMKNALLGGIMNMVLIIFSFTCIFPLIWMFYSSLKLRREFNADIISLPKAPTFSNYIDIATNPNTQIWQAMFNSLRATVLSILFLILFSFVIGYILARIKFPGNRAIYYMLLAGMLIPIHSLMVPVYVIFSDFGLTNKWFTLLIPYVSFALPLGVFLVQGFVKSLPTALEEAAAIDGSSFTRTLFQIIFPICMPILATVAIIQTFGFWNEFPFALILISDVRLQTVPRALRQLTGTFSSDNPKIMAAVLLTMSPIIVYYFVFSKNIIKGMVTGAVKG